MGIEHFSYMRDIHREMSELFSLEELNTLTLYLGVDWEQLSGGNKSIKINSLIQHMARLGRLEDLRELLQEERPNAKWPDVPTAEKQIEDERKLITADVRTLQDFIEKVTSLTINQDWLVLDKRNLEEQRRVLRFQVLALLTQMNGQEKGQLLRFLYGVGLVKESDQFPFNIDLSSANFEDADLRHANLNGASLSGINLRRADLAQAKNITVRKLLEQARLDKYTILPDGSKRNL